MVWVKRKNLLITASIVGVIGLLTATYCAGIPVKAATQNAATAPLTITRNLSLGSSGSDVLSLQETLKSQGFYTYPSITGYYGSYTEAAVKAYQSAHGIEAVGSTGPLTRASLAAYETYSVGGSAALSTGLSSQVELTQNLVVGSEGTQVTNLQAFLKAKGFYTYPSITGYYGSYTEAAVKAFQSAHHLPSNGTLDIATRAIILAAIAASKPLSITTPAVITTTTTISTPAYIPPTTTPILPTGGSGGGGGGGYVSTGGGGGGGGGGGVSVTLPIITNVNVVSISASSAMVTWDTNVAANSQIEFGTTTSYTSSSTLDSSLVTSHSVILTGLTINTTYHFEVISIDSLGNLTASTDATFITSANVDTTPPVVAIFAPASGATVSGTSVLLTASSTDNAAVAGVAFYIDGTKIGSEVTSSSTIFSSTWNSTSASNGSHSIFAVSRDTSNNYATSSAVSFTVSNSAPSISSISSGTPSQSSATITWTTDQAANSKVVYGLTTSYSSATSSAAFVTSHSLSVTGLASSTLYHYAVVSANSGGITSTSSDQSFTTGSTTSQTLEFGTLTLAGTGAAAPSITGNPSVMSAAIISGNGSGHWQISSNGMLTPTSAGQTAQLNQAPYLLGIALGTSSGTTTVNVNITTRSNTYTAATTSDITSLLGLNEGTQLSGKTIEVRSGYYDTSAYNFYDHFSGLTSPLTITAADTSNVPEIDHWAFAAPTTTPIGNVTFTHIHFYRPQLNFTSGEGAAVALVVMSGNVQNLTFSNDEFSSDLQPARTLGTSPTAQTFISSGYEIAGIYCGSHADCINLTVQNSKFHNMGDGIESEGNNLSYTNNEFYDLWADAFDLYPQGNNTATDKVLVKDNYFHDSIGDDGVLHPDFLQVYGQSTPGAAVDGDVNDVTVVGNIVLPGYEGIRQLPQMPETGGIASTSITSNHTFTSADVQHDWFIDATAGNITITLPTAASVGAVSSVIGFQKSDSSANTVTILTSGGDTINGGTSYTLKEAHQAVNFNSNGSNAYNGYAATPTIDGILAQNYNTPLYNHWIVEGNLFDVLTMHGITFENPVADTIIRNNSVFSPLTGDTNGDGVVDGSDGFTSTEPSINPWGQSSDMIEDNVSGGVTAAYQLSTATGTPQTLNNVSYTPTLANYENEYQGTSFNPLSNSDILGDLLLKPNGGLDTDNSGTADLGDVGALGTSATNGFYDFNGDATSSSFLIPTLSNVSGVGTSTTSANLNVDTDTDNGTIYYVVSTSASIPTATQIIAGEDASGNSAVDHASIAVSQFGLQTATSTVLATSTTYYAYFVQNSNAGQSAVVSTYSFSTLNPNYNEHLTSFYPAARLTSTGALNGGTTTPTGLFYSSFIVPNTINSSADLILASGTNMFVELAAVGTSTTSATIKTEWNNNPVALFGATTVYSGQRINLLVSMNGFATSTQYIWTSSSTQWVADATFAPISAHEANLNFTTNPYYIGEGSSGGALHFTGSIARLTLWQGITLPDISSSTVQNEFSDPTTGVTVNPTVSTGLYGTPLIDFYGPAASYNAGTNNGSGGNFVMTGTAS
jgi:peptidoglycan hydrolase-like protein with peptidoglycan-binding domain